MPKTSHTFRTVLLSLVGIAALATLVWVGFRDDPVPVDLTTVAAAPMQVTIDVDGRTRVRDLYEIAAPIAGLARRSPVRVGDRVIGGETVVAVVEPAASGLLDARSRMQADAQVSEAHAAVQVAETEYRRTENELAYAQGQSDRARTLVERGVSSVTQLEDAERRLAVAQAAVEESRARINMARGALERAEAALVEPAANGADSSACCVPILAPVDGVVLSVDVISARPVAAGARLAAIGDPSRIEIVADLLSADAVRLAPGAPATVERWGGDEPLAAVLRRIEPTARTVVSTLGIEEQRVDAIFDLDTDAGVAARLGDGFAVFLRVVEWQADDVLQVPLGATFRDAEGWAVFVVRDGVAQLRPVTLGRRNARMSEVLAGLAAGERVVTHPSDDLADGARVAERQP